MIKAILFDMDGILFDSEAYYMEGTYQQMISWGYQGPKEEIYRLIGTSMEETVNILFELLEGKKSKEDIEKDNWNYFSVEHPLNPKEIMFPGVEDCLAQLKSKGIKMALCSSSPWVTVVDSLDKMGVRDYFDFVESGENLEHFKPEPDIYLEALKFLGVEKEEAVVYEDSRIGIESGKRAGIFTVAREDKRYNQDQSRADKLVKDIQEFAQWIERKNHGNSH